MTVADRTRPRDGEGPARPTRDLRAAQLSWLAAGLFVVAAGYGTLLPLLPAWLTSVLPGGGTREVSRAVGFVSAAYAIGLLVGAPVWGMIADRIGRRRIVLIGLVGYASSLMSLLLPGAHGLWALGGLRGAAGFFVGAFVPVATALIAEHTPEKKRARRFAWVGAVSLLGLLVSPALIDAMTWLALRTGRRAASPERLGWVLITASSLASAVIMLGLARTLPKSFDQPSLKGAAQAPARPVSPAALWWMSAAVNAALAGLEVIMTLQGQSAGDGGARDVSWMFAVCGAVMLGINGVLFFSALMEKVSPRLLVGAGLLAAIGGLTLLGAVGGRQEMYWGLRLTAAGTGLAYTLISYVAAGMSRQTLGRTMGSLAAGVAAGQAAGSFGGAWLFTRLAQPSFFVLAAMLSGVFFLLLLRPTGWPARPARGAA